MGTLKKQIQLSSVLALLCASCGVTTVRVISQAGKTTAQGGIANDDDTNPGLDPRESNTIPAVPPADAHLFYVSSTTGDDSNTGLSPNAPFKTINKGLQSLRKGFPDQLLLKRGDDFTGTLNLSGSSLGGRSTTERMIIASYGTSNKRPRVKAQANGNGVVAQGGTINNFAIVGIFFHANLRDPSDSSYAGASGSGNGLTWRTSTNDLVIEDCMFKAFHDNIVIEGYEVSINNVQLRFNIIVDAYSADNAAHSEGAYFYNMHGLNMTGNLFDHNGWSPDTSVSGGKATIFNHNVYIKENVDNVVVRNNIFARASSHGMQARSGGIVEGNLFLDNPIHMSFGHVNGSPVRAGGVVGHVTGNVALGSNTINGSPRGSGVEVGNIRPASGVRVADNIFSNDDGQTNGSAISLPEPSGITNPQDYVGVNDLTIEDNITQKWTNSYGKSAKKTSNVALKNNDFNTFPQNSLTNRSIASYDGSLDTFLNGARAQNARSFDDKYDAATVIGYIRQGFGLK